MTCEQGTPHGDANSLISEARQWCGLGWIDTPCEAPRNSITSWSSWGSQARALGWRHGYPSWTVSQSLHGNASSNPFPRKVEVPSTLGGRFLMFQTPGALTPLYGVQTVCVSYSLCQSVSHVFSLFNYEADGPVLFLPILLFPHPQQRTLYRVTFDIFYHRFDLIHIVMDFFGMLMQCFIPVFWNAYTHKKYTWQ